MQTQTVNITAEWQTLMQAERELNARKHNLQQHMLVTNYVTAKSLLLCKCKVCVARVVRINQGNT